VCFRAADGTTQSLIHQKVEDYNKDSDVKEMAASYKEDIMKVNYKELIQIPNNVQN
jgi:hypothetical protein